MVAAPEYGLTMIQGRARANLIAHTDDGLRRVASHLMCGERIDHTRSPAAVVHAAVICLWGEGEAVRGRAADRGFLVASTARDRLAGRLGGEDE
jgi:hypothetical protein